MAIEGGRHGDGPRHINRLNMGITGHNFCLSFKTFITLYSVKKAEVVKAKWDLKKEVQTLLTFSPHLHLSNRCMKWVWISGCRFSKSYRSYRTQPSQLQHLKVVQEEGLKRCIMMQSIMMLTDLPQELWWTLLRRELSVLNLEIFTACRPLSLIYCSCSCVQC